MRNHDAKWEQYECGEGNLCGIWGSVISAGAGLLGSLLGGKKEADSAADMARQTGDRNVAAAKMRPWDAADPYLRQFLGNAQGIYSQQGFSPPTNALELLGRKNALGYAEDALPGMIDATQQSWMTGLDPGLNPYVGAMIEAGQNDLTQDYQRNTLPAIADQAQAVGGYGGSRQGVAEGIASEGLLEAQGDLSARLLSQAHQDSLRQQQAAWNAAPDMLNMGLMPSDIQQRTGEQYRGDARQGAENLQGYAGMLSPYAQFGQGPSNAYQATQPFNPVNSAIGGALTGYGAYNAWSQNRTPAASPAVSPTSYNSSQGLYNLGLF